VSTARAEAPTALVDGLRRLEDAAELDGAVAALDRVGAAVVRPGVVRDALVGRWLGHAVHPLLTDLPIGFWTSASVLDVLGGRRARPAADLMLALGIVSAVPTVATGLAEWREAGRREQRVGVVHASANAAALAFYAKSWLARRRGQRAGGVALALTGAAVATVGGYLGGHLATARKVGTRDPAFTAD
jgi:uncharacterized membrane protein